MTQAALPAPLQPWHAWLQWFAPELALQLGHLLQRMHPLLGRFGGRRQGGIAEPDGLEDLRRRGAYERLLASEWLLASDLPDEFLRRAANGEHLFLAPRPRAQKVDRLIVALFDAGPWQMGAPRLAHIALWILLARRAAEAGGELRWGLLHEPGRCHDAKSPKDLKDLLRGRTLQSADQAQWQQWAQWLSEQEPAAGEIWLVGHRCDVPPQGADAPTHHLSLRPSLDGQALHLALRAGTAVRKMDLPLPEPHPASQLLRGRFEDTTPIVQPGTDKFSLKIAPLISANGSLVAVPLLEGHGVMLYRIQDTSHRKRQTPKRVQWSRNAEPLAASFSGKVIGVLLGVDMGLGFWQMPHLSPQPRPPREAFDAPPGRRTLLPSAWMRDQSHTRLFVVDASHQLVYWVSGHGTEARGPMLLDRHVAGIALTGDQWLAYVCASEGQLLLRFAGAAGRDTVDVRLMECAGEDGALPTVLFGGCQHGLRRWGGVAVRLRGAEGRESWRVFASGHVFDQLTSWELTLPPGAHAVGLARDTASGRFALVTQSAHGTEFTRQFQDAAESLCILDSPVERASVCPTSGLMALLTRDRALHVYSAAADRLPRLVVPSVDATSRGASDADA